MAFMFLIFLGFIAVISTKVLESKENERLKIAEDIATTAKNEIELASTSTNGYKRNFDLPISISGNAYTIQILDNRELVVNYIDKEHILFLEKQPAQLADNKICGDLFISDNEVDKENEVVCVNSNLDQTQCQNAEDGGLCDDLDIDFLPGSRCCCCARYNLCCS